MIWQDWVAGPRKSEWIADRSTKLIIQDQTKKSFILRVAFLPPHRLRLIAVSALIPTTPDRSALTTDNTKAVRPKPQQFIKEPKGPEQDEQRTTNRKRYQTAYNPTEPRTSTRECEQQNPGDIATKQQQQASKKTNKRTQQNSHQYPRPHVTNTARSTDHVRLPQQPRHFCNRLFSCICP